MYQPNGYGQQYPGQKLPGQQYPQGVPIGDDKFKFDPVSKLSIFIFVSHTDKLWGNRNI